MTNKIFLDFRMVTRVTPTTGFSPENTFSHIYYTLPSILIARSIHCIFIFDYSTSNICLLSTNGLKESSYQHLSICRGKKVITADIAYIITTICLIKNIF